MNEFHYLFIKTCFRLHRYPRSAIPSVYEYCFQKIPYWSLHDWPDRSVERELLAVTPCRDAQEVREVATLAYHMYETLCACGHVPLKDLALSNELIMLVNYKESKI